MISTSVAEFLGGAAAGAKKEKRGALLVTPSNGILVALGSVLLSLTLLRRCRHGVWDSRRHLILDRSSRHTWAFGRLGEMLGRERVDLDAPFVLGGVQIQKEVVGGGILGGCGGRGREGKEGSNSTMVPVLPVL